MEIHADVHAAPLSSSHCVELKYWMCVCLWRWHWLTLIQIQSTESR